MGDFFSNAQKHNRQKFELNRQQPSDILPRMGCKKCVVNQ